MNAPTSSLLDYDKIEYIHFEVTSRCNAACPDCPRTNNNILPLSTWTYDEFIQTMPVELLARLDRIGFCGNYGDPIVARDLIPICAYIREHSDCLIRIHTNGSARTQDWWRELAETISPNGLVVWGIDGLEDTNHIYRVNTNWDDILRNIRAFHAFGGRSHWQFIPFEHCVHQVDEARELATRLGFEKFLERSVRQIQRTDNPVRYDWSTIPVEPEAREPFNVQCSAIERKMIYISAEGLVFPCCWTGNIYQTNLEVSELVQRHGKNSINAKKVPIPEIIQGSLWEEISQWKLLTCNRWCGTKEPRPIVKAVDLIELQR